MAFRLSRSESIPLLKQDMTITPVLIGLIGSALVLGVVLGATLGGIAADRIGRKRAFIADMAILVAGSALCAVARDPAYPGWPVSDWGQNRHRFSDQRFVCVGDHAARFTQPHDGCNDCIAIRRHGARCD